ncbi:MAG: NAD-dependent epimerase/dehydratase family protein [Chloroflexota bacterium]
MRFWNDKNVLVTGGASFIGSHLVDRLVEAGARVRVADDLSSGREANLSGSRSEVDLMVGDLREREFAHTVMAGQQVVFHLAACHGGRGFIDTHPADCASNMVLDGMVFDEACKAGVDKIAFASSACVYPTRLQEAPTNGVTTYLKEEWADPFKEGAAGADGEYGWAKLMGEMTLRAYNKQHGLRSVACRLFTVYGERENESHAIIALIAKAFTGMDPYPIWGNGQQDRNFTYVGDIVEGMLRAAASDIDDGSALNIGTAEHVKIIESAHMIFEETGFQPDKIDFDLSKPVGVFSRAADLSRTRARLGWEPSTRFRDGLRATIRWYYDTHDRKHVASQLNRLLTER